MSYLMVLRIPVEPDGMRRAAEEHSDLMKGIAQRGKAAGAIHHDFFAGDGELIVVDEWDSPDDFHAFFESQGEDIGRLMAAAGATGEPGPPVFWERMSLGDEF